MLLLFKIETNDVEEEDNVVLNQGALVLASLDRRACARSQLQDANALYDQVVLPSCLPWSQCQNMLYKTLPRDIDELSSVLFQDTGELATAYRLSDPGLVELCTDDMVEDDTSKRRTPKRQRFVNDVRAEDSSSSPGEWSMQMYHEVQWNQRQSENLRNTKKRIISFRVGSTSSRASIFDSQTPLFLVAIYPRQLHEGTKRHGLEAYEYGMDLGSYNCRPLPPKESVLLSDAPSSKHRFVAGRARIIWSEKERPESKSQRCAYRSILNGQRLDANSLKRPLHVKVGVRINKALLCFSGNRSIPLDVSAVTNHNKKSLVSSSYVYSNKVIEDSLNFACERMETCTSQLPTVEESTGHDLSQCTLNVEKYVADIARVYHLSFGESPNLLAYRPTASNEPFSIERFVSLAVSMNAHVGRVSLHPENHGTGIPFGDYSRFQTQLRIVPPRLEFLPTEDGQMHVTCTKSGTLVHSTHVESLAIGGMLECTDAQPSQKSSSVLLRTLATETSRCAICWNNLSKGFLFTCQGCNVSAHSTCVNIANERSMDRDDWLCSSCAHVGEERICGLCNFSEGILRPWKENQWIHNICRTWCGIDGTKPVFADGNTDNDILLGASCHLCSKEGTPVVMCFGVGCSMRFHPMCALVASMAQEIRCFELNVLPSKYTLTMMRTSFSSGRQPTLTKVLPVAFCPYHTPRQGCDPVFESSTVRIPPRRREKSHATTS